jgi:hypothetical protein
VLAKDAGALRATLPLEGELAVVLDLEGRHRRILGVVSASDVARP